jgi:hypothetical protein
VLNFCQSQTHERLRITWLDRAAVGAAVVDAGGSRIEDVAVGAAGAAVGSRCNIYSLLSRSRAVTVFSPFS